MKHPSKYGTQSSSIPEPEDDAMTDEPIYNCDTCKVLKHNCKEQIIKAWAYCNCYSCLVAQAGYHGIGFKSEWCLQGKDGKPHKPAKTALESLLMENKEANVKIADFEKSMEEAKIIIADLKAQLAEAKKPNFWLCARCGYRHELLICIDCQNKEYDERLKYEKAAKPARSEEFLTFLQKQVFWGVEHWEDVKEKYLALHPAKDGEPAQPKKTRCRDEDD